jgi:hypothetical protein
MESPRCLICKNCIGKDIGYSEYTITGEAFLCRELQFDGFVYDDEPNEMAKLKKIGDRCKFFKEGSKESHAIDCNISENDLCNCDRN